MGLDLTLIPDRYYRNREADSKVLAYDRIQFRRDTTLFDQILKLPATTSPIVISYEDDGLHETARLHEVTAGVLGSVIPDGPIAPWNLAILAFVRHLPPDTLIVLWWH
jgi:hypothetical protein